MYLCVSFEVYIKKKTIIFQGFPQNILMIP